MRNLVFGDIGHFFNVFVQDNLGYDIILGQPWRAQMLCGLQCNRDGSETITVESWDGEKKLESVCVRADDKRHIMNLRSTIGKPQKAWVDVLTRQFGPGWTIDDLAEAGNSTDF